MRYVVGFTGTERARDAVALATSLAMTQGAKIDLVTVLNPPQDGSVAKGAKAAEESLKRAQDELPAGLESETHVRVADSFAEGLLETAQDLNAGLIVIGPTNAGLLRRFTVGTVATALLHASSVPVALAPRGYRHRDKLTRLTCAVGGRTGADAVLDVAVEAAARRGLPLRLISLVALDAHGTTHPIDTVKTAHEHARTLLSKAQDQLPQDHESTVTVAHGRSIEQAMDDVDWDPGELVIVGSSRLAQRRQLFIGSTANKMLRGLPVPMVVVPRDWQRTER
ncbi:universal stress protein [Arthrobacter roseus]|uniref:universal stress protein n=1 Tax=Arthrobacter roseus TaxID=136274 RepID=UPI00196596DE|nr:universal stress protein [Arthrobacter roseus]MBM7849421.1 nucleotide-binding universal stress UspA family protein [Arthrobacter roseus]